MLPGHHSDALRLYTVAETARPIRVCGGMTIVPDHTFANAPPPKVLVIPTQANPSDAMLEWIRTATKATDVTMSVCTSAFVRIRAEISGYRLAERRFQPSLSRSARIDGGASALRGLLDGGRYRNCREISLSGEDVLLLHGRS